MRPARASMVTKKKRSLRTVGPCVAHLGGGGGKDAVLGELVEAGDDELEGDEVEDGGGDAEEALEVDADAAADEEDSEDYGYGYA